MSFSDAQDAVQFRCQRDGQLHGGSVLLVEEHEVSPPGEGVRGIVESGPGLGSQVTHGRGPMSAANGTSCVDVGAGSVGDVTECFDPQLNCVAHVIVDGSVFATLLSSGGLAVGVDTDGEAAEGGEEDFLGMGLAGGGVGDGAPDVSVEGEFFSVGSVMT